MEKQCKECLISKTLDQFREQRNICKKCNYKKQKSNYKKSNYKKKHNIQLFIINDKNIFDEIIINKLCNICNENKNITDFTHGRRSCKLCENKKTVSYRIKKKEEFKNDTLNKKFCTKCNIEQTYNNFTKTGGNVCNECEKKYQRDHHNGLLDIKKIIINENNEKQCSKCKIFNEIDDYLNGNNICHKCRCDYYTYYFKNNI